MTPMKRHFTMMKGGKTMKGFSLGEVILSIVVLTVGLLPILGSMNGAFVLSRDSQDTVIAAGLAQEGVELIVNVRDNGVLLSSDAFIAFPYAGASSNHASADNCRIDYDSSVLTGPSDANKIDCSDSGSNRYDLTVSGGFYEHAGVAGKFERRIYLSMIGPASGPTAYEVVSAVYWGGYGDTATNINTIANLRANCVIANKCVYSDARLAPWR
jgi:hypothetical protein